MTLAERLEANEYADKFCFHCMKEIKATEEVCVWEDHQDGTYCSKECLLQEMKWEEFRDEE